MLPTKKLLKTVKFLNSLLEKMEILHLNFCRYFWNNVYMCPHCENICTMHPTNWLAKGFYKWSAREWRPADFCNLELVYFPHSKLRAGLFCFVLFSLSLLLFRHAAAGIALLCEATNMAHVLRKPKLSLEFSLWVDLGPHFSSAHVWSSSLVFLVPKRVVGWFVSFYICSFGGLYCVCVHVKYFNKETVFLQSGLSAGLPTDLSYITEGAAAWGRELPWQMFLGFLI